MRKRCLLCSSCQNGGGSVQPTGSANRPKTVTLLGPSFDPSRSLGAVDQNTSTLRFVRFDPCGGATRSERAGRDPSPCFPSVRRWRQRRRQRHQNNVRCSRLPETSRSRPRLPLLPPATSAAPARRRHPHQQPRRRPSAAPARRRHPHQQPRRRPPWTRAQDDRRHPLLSFLILPMYHPPPSPLSHTLLACYKF
jgi:hypothetical protein